MQPNQMLLPRTQKYLSEYFPQCLKSGVNFEHFQKHMTLIADVFPKFWAPSEVVKSISEKSCLRRPFKKQHGKLVQTL